MNKLSKRISSLVKLALEHDYQCIYDTCCDHGKIGLSLFKNKQAIQEVIFVDIVPQIISQLKTYIADIPNSGSFLKTQNISVSDITFSKKDLVIIAGVGSDLILDSLRTHKKRGLIPKHYLLSPHTKHLECRKALNEMGFKLVGEVLIEEDNIFYDHLLISSEEGENIFPINRNSQTKTLTRYYAHHVKILKLKATHGDEMALNYLNIIKGLTIL